MQQRNTFCGTLEYMAPEMVLEKGHEFPKYSRNFRPNIHDAEGTNAGCLSVLQKPDSSICSTNLTKSRFAAEGPFLSFFPLYQMPATIVDPVEIT